MFHALVSRPADSDRCGVDQHSRLIGSAQRNDASGMQLVDNDSASVAIICSYQHGFEEIAQLDGFRLTLSSSVKTRECLACMPRMSPRYPSCRHMVPSVCIRPVYLIGVRMHTAVLAAATPTVLPHILVDPAPPAVPTLLADDAPVDADDGGTGQAIA